MYREAYEKVKSNEHLFPYRGLYYYWLLCAATGVSTELGLQEFRKALDSGYWFNDELLKGDEELEALQGTPEYQHIIEISNKRRAEAQAKARPELLMLPPETGQSFYPLLLALHGNSRSLANAVDDWRSVVAQGWLLAMPQSSQIDEPDAYVWNDWERVAQEIQQHYTTISKKYPVDSSKVVIGGFSMGGGLAAWLALRNAIPVRGFMLVAPYIPDLEKIAAYVSTRCFTL